MRRRPLMVAVVAAVLGLVVGVLPAAAASPPNDPLFKAQWGLTAINAPPAWSVSTAKGVLIGVVDTGADLLHEDLGAKVAASTNCIGANGDPGQCHGAGQDDNGHGSEVAGVAAAVTGNGKGIAGTAPDAKLLVAKALDAGESANSADIVAAIHWVVDHGARVVNLSLGDPSFTETNVIGPALRDSIEYAWSKGAIPVLASGNSNMLGFGINGYGNLDAIVVGAVGRDGTVAGYSTPSGNAKWAVLAPGGSADGTPADDILSTSWQQGVPNAYKTAAGTSMAAPFVSGTLAMLLASGLSPANAVARLLATVNTHVSCGVGSDNCRGMVDAGAALGTPTTSHPTSSTPPAPTSSTVLPATATSAPASPTLPPAPVMNPAHHSPTTAPPSAPHAKGPAQSSSPTLKDTHAVALTPVTNHHTGTSIAWFFALGALFLLLAGAGVVWIVRASPDPDV